MTIDTWSPPDYDLRAAGEGYMHYLTGAVVLHNPANTEAIHRVSPKDQDDLKSLTLSAEGLIIGGLRQLIEHTNAPQLRHSRKLMARYFDAAAPHMATTIDTVFEQEAERIHNLSPILYALRPAPILNHTIYQYLCRSKYGKLQTLWLMDELPPDLGLLPTLNGRTLAEYAAKYARTNKKSA